MKTKDRREPTHRPSLFDEGKPTTAVPLQDDTWSLVETEDYLRLVEEEGFPSQWYAALNGQNVPYVRVRLPGKGQCVAVSRLVVGALPGERVIYRNGNTLDLRRGNLIRVALCGLQQRLTAH